MSQNLDFQSWNACKQKPERCHDLHLLRTVFDTLQNVEMIAANYIN